MRTLIFVLIALSFNACQTTAPFKKTVQYLDIERYMGKWYVISSRPTMFEKNAFNATETYSLDPKTGKIDVDFRYRKSSFSGPEKNIPQRARIFNKESNAHWKIRLKWLPFEFDYLIIGLSPDYEWTAVGVPNQKYLWIMSRKPHMEADELNKIINQLSLEGYNVDNLEFVPQKPD
jgi:apolipoprotein D and lipocalin family protein